MLANSAICFVINLICICSAIDDLPSYFPRCHIDLEPSELNACILKASEQLREHIKKGVPEVDIPPMDPLIVPEIKTEQGTDAVNYKLTLTNAKIQGLGDYEFSEFKYNPKTLSFHGKALFKAMSIESDYVMDGKILLAPIQGKGHLKADIRGTSSGTIDVLGKLVKRKGEEYYEPSEVKAKITIGDIKSTFDGLFGGNKQLELATRELLKEHSNEIIKEVTPAIEKVAAELVTKMMSGINKNVPYKKLFPSSP